MFSVGWYHELQQTRLEVFLMAPLDVNALVFDVFGMVVDWRSDVIRDSEKLRGKSRRWPLRVVRHRRPAPLTAPASGAHRELHRHLDDGRWVRLQPGRHPRRALRERPQTR